MKVLYQTLVKRELWEHRWLWLAPVVAAGLMILVALVGVVAWSNSGMNFRLPPGANVGDGVGMPGASAMWLGVIGLTAQLWLISGVVVSFYLLDCLYAERKDRSILFWKSLPVSDFQTVISKFSVGMLVPVVVTFVLVTAVYPVMHAINSILAPSLTQAIGGWNTADWLRAEGRVLACMLVTTLWYAPLCAWYMLASVISSRSPYFMAGLPILVLGILESFVFHTGNVWRFVVWHMTPVFHPWEGLQRPSLWIGLAVTAGMLYIVIRLRRYRDDT